MTSATAERALAWLLLVMGVVAALAVVPMVMPTAWMVATHDWIGLGEYPHSTLTEYLTRSLSGVYALFGALVIYISRDVRRYRDLIVVMGWLTAFLGLALSVLDFTIGMPAAWTWGEGPPTIVIGLTFIWLARKID